MGSAPSANSGSTDTVARGHSLYQFLPPNDDDGLGYWRGLSALWDSPDTIVNVEWDMEFSPALVDALLACPHPLCTHAYQMHIPRTYYAHSARRDGMDGFWLGKGVEWAAYSAIGFCKIAPQARVRPLARDVWRGVEMQVNAATDGPFHVHWPAIRHYHQ